MLVEVYLPDTADPLAVGAVHVLVQDVVNAVLIDAHRALSLCFL